jgi:hypothetical protein
MNKDTKAMWDGFVIDGGAERVEFVARGKHRVAHVQIPGLGLRLVEKLPSTSPRDDAALRRKARDMVKRFRASPEMMKQTW